MSGSISNTDNLIDVRDITERFEELETELEEAHGGTVGVPLEDWIGNLADDGDAALQAEATEYRTLEGLLEDLAGSGADYQWRSQWYPGTLISDSHFTKYAQQLAEDLGVVSRDLAWPACYIDWDAAANALQTDYSCVEFDGETYWYR